MRAGEVAAVVGAVGAGKSLPRAASSASRALRETAALAPRATPRDGGLAFAAQARVVLNATLRENAFGCACDRRGPRAVRARDRGRAAARDLEQLLAAT